MVHGLEHFLLLKAGPSTFATQDDIRVILQATAIPAGEPTDLAARRLAREAAYVTKANAKAAQKEIDRSA